MDKESPLKSWKISTDLLRIQRWFVDSPPYQQKVTRTDFQEKKKSTLSLLKQDKAYPIYSNYKPCNTNTVNASIIEVKYRTILNSNFKNHLKARNYPKGWIDV